MGHREAGLHWVQEVPVPALAVVMRFGLATMVVVMPPLASAGPPLQGAMGSGWAAKAVETRGEKLGVVGEKGPVGAPPTVVEGTGLA